MLEGQRNRNRDRIPRSHRRNQDALEEDSRKLLMRKAESPQTQVRRSVGHSAEHEFDGCNGLIIRLAIIFGFLTLSCTGASSSVIKLC